MDPAVRAAGPPVAAVDTMVHRRALAQPAAEAVNGISYSELDEWATKIAFLLRGKGVATGSAVALRLSPGARLVAALLGILRAGCHFVVLGWNDPLDRCAGLLTEVAPGCLLAERGVMPGQAGPGELTSWFTKTLGGVVLDEFALDAAMAQPGSEAAGEPEAATPLEAAAYVVYTSGSTGAPKGIMQSHGGLAQLVTWMGEEFKMGPGRRVAQWASSNYDAAFCEIFATLACGGSLCCVPESLRIDANLLVDWLAAQQVNLFQTVPSFARELLHAISVRRAGQKLAALDHLLLAGEPLPADLAASLSAALPGIRLVNLYGPTEAMLATWMEVSGRWPGTVPVGRPIPGRQILVLDSSGRPCRPGVAGEIVVRSPYLTVGYVGSDGETASGFTFVRVPGDTDASAATRCYRTGDRGRWRRDGLLEFLGRRDHQVKVRGIRIELDEIEASLAGHESVLDCVVVTRKGADDLVDALVAYVVPAGACGSPEVWRAHLRQRFSEQVLPSAFVMLPSLPRNAGGKVDRRRLQRANDEEPAM
jgi:(S)-beta-tyrosine adenylation enzyme